MPTQAVIEIDSQDRGPNLPSAISVQFNPTEYGVTKGAQMAEIGIPGIDSAIIQFVRGQTATLTLELFFDSSRDGSDVRTLTDPVAALVKIQPDTHAPPRIRFVWGQGLSFRAIVDNVQQKFTLFKPDGIPLRAMLTVSFKEYKTLEEQLKELNLKSSDHTKLRIIRRGDTLARIAFEEYRDAAQWRLIADHPDNQERLTDLRRLTPGMRISVPAIDVLAAPGTGARR